MQGVCYKCGAVDQAINMPVVYKDDQKLVQCCDHNACAKNVAAVKEALELEAREALEKANQAFLEEFGDDILDRLRSLPRVSDASEHYYDLKTGNILSCNIGEPKYKLRRNPSENLRNFFGEYIKELTTGMADASKLTGHPKNVVGMTYKNFLEYVKTHNLDHIVDVYNCKRVGGQREDMFYSHKLYVELKGPWSKDIPEDAIVCDAYGGE